MNDVVDFDLIRPLIAFIRGIDFSKKQITFSIPKSIELDNSVILLYFENDCVLTWTRDLDDMSMTFIGTVKDPNVFGLIISEWKR